MKNPCKRLFLYLCLKFLGFTFSSTWAQSSSLHLESWKRLKLTMEGDLNNLPTPRKDEVQSKLMIAECTGWFELALEVIHQGSLCLQLYDCRMISLHLEEWQHRAVACGLMGWAAASGSDSCRDPIITEPTSSRNAFRPLDKHKWQKCSSEIMSAAPVLPPDHKCVQTYSGILLELKTGICLGLTLRFLFSCLHMHESAGVKMLTTSHHWFFILTGNTYTGFLFLNRKTFKPEWMIQCPVQSL